MTPDVIVAAATPWGVAALSVVRLSGPGLGTVLERCVRGRHGALPPPDRPRRVWVLDSAGGVLDDGVLVWQDHGGTYTGEPTAELTLHGNPALVQAAIEAFQHAGARLARPGAFTRRAVLHGKLDLVQAEAVHQLTHAPTLDGALLARQGLEGTLSAEVGELRHALVHLVAELEARLDYPADDLALDTDQSVIDGLTQVAGRARALAATHTAGRLRIEGARVALVGVVNAGKSSLFNRLLGQTRALVHDQPGTTRDVVEARLTLDGLGVTLLDTAGERVTDDPVEAAGLALARDLVADADLLVVVLRAGPGGLSAAERGILARTEDRRRVVVLNGVDRDHVAVPGALPTSARTGEGLEALRAALVAGLREVAPRSADPVIASARQRDRLLELARACDEAIIALPVAGVAVAADLATSGLEALDALTGADTREEVLDALFARFCIGK